MVSAFASPASALTEGSIDHVEPREGSINLLFSVPVLQSGVNPEVDSVEVSIDGVAVEAAAELATTSKEKVRRTAILAIDVSNSMRGERFEQAKVAAEAFLETVPDDVYVGVVAFAGDVETVQEPTLNRAAASSVVAQLDLSHETRLYDGVIEAVSTAGMDGQRSVLVLSDGRDTSSTALEDVTAAIETSEIKVDVVALAQAANARAPLEAMAGIGGGSVLSADDPKSLTEVFSAEAEALANQVAITAIVPPDRDQTEGSVTVSISAGSETYTDKAFVTVSNGTVSAPTAKSTPLEVAAPRFAITPTMMIAGLGSAAVAILFVLLLSLGVFDRDRTETLAERIAAYSRTGDARSAAGTPGVRLASPQKAEGMTQSAVGVAEKALRNSAGIEAALGARLEGAGLALKPAEWLLVHAGIAVGAALIGFLLSGGGLILCLVLLAVGLIIPWVYLGFKKSRRLKSFNAQLADCLQLMAGSLSAGLSLAQSVDTVVREGNDPISGEFRHALVEARLGVEIEDALESVGQRMESKDFHWIVMAIRIQREVGGNLGELLLQVAETLREREYLRRQVSALSAEGRLSAWILGGLPPGFILYLGLSKPGYLEPLITTRIGWAMCAGIVIMTLAGGLWMKKLVKVEV